MPSAPGGRDRARRSRARLAIAVPLRTLQYRLKQLVDAGRLVKEGKGPSANTGSRAPQRSSE